MPPEERVKYEAAMKRCRCPEWKKGIKDIIDVQLFANTHGMFWEGVRFTYCPWCSEQLDTT